MEKHWITLKVNGELYSIEVESRETLLHVLRERLELTGTKEGCNIGDCGACSVIFNNKVVRACLVLALEADNAVIETIEGLNKGDQLHPIQQAFVDSGAIQCGFCTPGMIITTKAMLQEKPNPSTEEVKEYLAGNLCRCTGYVKILDAVEKVKELSKER